MSKAVLAGLVISLALAVPAAAQEAPGDADALVFQASHLYGEQKYAEAMPLYRQAAKLDNAQAQFAIGVMYMLGQGVAQDDTKAGMWLGMAAEHDMPEAQYNLALLSHAGRGMIADKAKAVDLLTLAANHGMAEAQLSLGMLYEVGDGVDKSPVVARTWFEKAAAQGNPEAQKRLQALPPAP